jgi:predicted outer membrane protein
MPGFMQIMEIETSRIDEVEAFAKKMQEERGDALLASKATITQDRDRAGHYFIIVEFDSYEQAMKNSNDPVTSRYAEQMGALLDGPPRFYNLDVRMVQTVR